MLYFFTGTDREKAREAMNAAVARASKGARPVRISDASAVADIHASLQGGGMFGEERSIVFDGVFANEEMRALVEKALPDMKESSEQFFIFEEKLDAQTKRTVEKYAESTVKFYAAKQKKDGDIFELARALRRGDKKTLWVGYQRALSRDDAPEAIHGVLFWGAKEALLAARNGKESERAKKLVATLAELPHESRRRGVELEYALEHFILTAMRTS